MKSEKNTTSHKIEDGMSKAQTWKKKMSLSLKFILR